MTEDHIWDKAPLEATHYTPEGVGTNWVYWRFEGSVVKSVWVDSERNLDGVYWYLDQGFYRTDYPEGMQPDICGTSMIKRVWEKSEWSPSIGDRVMYKNIDSLDYAWDKPEEMKVISIHEGMYGLLGDCGYFWSPLRHLTPIPKTPSQYELFEGTMLGILLDGWQTSPSRAKALCKVLYEKGLRFVA